MIGQIGVSWKDMYYRFTLRNIYNAIKGYYRQVERQEYLQLYSARLTAFYTLKASTKKVNISRADQLFALPGEQQSHKKAEPQSQEDFEAWQHEMKALVAKDLKAMK